MGYPDATITYNSALTDYDRNLFPKGLFGGDRPDFVIDFRDGSPLQVFELKPVGQEAFGARQLQGDLAVANAGLQPGEPLRAVAGDPSLLLGGLNDISLTTPIGLLLPGQTYNYFATSTSGVATYTQQDRPSALSQAIGYLSRTAPSSGTTILPLLTSSGVVL